MPLLWPVGQWWALWLQLWLAQAAHGPHPACILDLSHRFTCAEWTSKSYGEMLPAASHTLLITLQWVPYLGTRIGWEQPEVLLGTTGWIKAIHGCIRDRTMMGTAALV